MKVGRDFKSEHCSILKEHICLLGFKNNFVIMDCFNTDTFLSNKCLKNLNTVDPAKSSLE